MNSQRPLLMNFAIPSNVTSSNNCTGFSFSSSLASPFLTPVPADICKLCRNFWRAFKLTKKNNNNKKNKIKKKIKNTFCFSSFTYTNYNKGEKKQIKKIMKKSIFLILLGLSYLKDVPILIELTIPLISTKSYLRPLMTLDQTLNYS